MSYIHISQCEICKQLGWGHFANLLFQESLPPAAYQLDSCDRLPGSSATWYVRCPICKCPYEFELESGCMEYDLGVSRMLPQYALKKKVIGIRYYKKMLEHLPLQLISKNISSQEYAARALAHAYLDEGETEKVIELLTHKYWRVRMQACYAVSNADRDGVNMDPYVDTLLELSYDRKGKVRDASDYIFRIYEDKDFRNIKKYWNKLMDVFSRRDMHYHQISLLRKVERTKKIGTFDITPCVYKLIKFFTKEEEYDYLYKDVHKILDAYVTHSKKNARHFLKQCARFKGKKFVSSLDGVVKHANEKVNKG